MKGGARLAAVGGVVAVFGSRASVLRRRGPSTRLPRGTLALLLRRRRSRRSRRACPRCCPGRRRRVRPMPAPTPMRAPRPRTPHRRRLLLHPLHPPRHRRRGCRPRARRGSVPPARSSSARSPRSRCTRPTTPGRPARRASRRPSRRRSIASWSEISPSARRSKQHARSCACTAAPRARRGDRGSIRGRRAPARRHPARRMALRRAARIRRARIRARRAHDDRGRPGRRLCVRHANGCSPHGAIGPVRAARRAASLSPPPEPLSAPASSTASRPCRAATSAVRAPSSRSRPCSAVNSAARRTTRVTPPRRTAPRARGDAASVTASSRPRERPRRRLRVDPLRGDAFVDVECPRSRRRRLLRCRSLRGRRVRAAPNGGKRAAPS